MAAQAGVVWRRNSSLKEIGSLLRNPLAAVPQETRTERLVLTRTFGRLRAYVCDPALVRELLVGHADDLVKSEVTKRILEPALGAALLTAEGRHWQWQRQATAPGFRPANLSVVIPDMLAGAVRTKERWLSRPPGSSVDLMPEMIATTFEIVLDTMLSGSSVIDASSFERELNAYLALTPWMFAQALLGLPRGFPHPGSRRARNAVIELKRLVQHMLDDRRSKESRDDLVGKLIEAKDPETGRRMNDEEIVENILTFVIAGHETNASALTWTLGMLAHRPEHQDAIADEVRTVTNGGPLRAEHVMRLETTMRVANEAMRLYPPVGLIARTVLRKIVLAGTTLPAGSTVIVPIYAIHRNPAIWPDPEVFRPERFSPAESEARSRFAHLPFGAGSRICIGGTFALYETAAVLAVLVSAFRLEPLGEMPEPILKVTLRPVTPLLIRLQARH